MTAGNRFVKTRLPAMLEPIRVCTFSGKHSASLDYQLSIETSFLFPDNAVSIPDLLHLRAHTPRPVDVEKP